MYSMPSASAGTFSPQFALHHPIVSQKFSNYSSLHSAMQSATAFSQPNLSMFAGQRLQKRGAVNCSFFLETSSGAPSEHFQKTHKVLKKSWTQSCFVQAASRWWEGNQLSSQRFLKQGGNSEGSKGSLPEGCESSAGSAGLWVQRKHWPHTANKQNNTIQNTSNWIVDNQRSDKNVQKWGAHFATFSLVPHFVVFLGHVCDLNFWCQRIENFNTCMVSGAKKVWSYP